MGVLARQEPLERGVPDDAGVGGHELPHHDVGEVGDGRQLARRVGNGVEGSRCGERGRGTQQPQTCVGHILAIGA